MTAASATLAGRAAAEALMVDACTITRGGGSMTLDANGEYVAPPGASVYSGPCRLKPGGTDVVVDVPGQSVSLYPYTVAVPVDATAYALDDTVTITACALDPAAVGLVLRVRHVAVGSHLSARRLGCEVDAG